eukprot:2207847-Pleurochrysis_carterae.AAC.1
MRPRDAADRGSRGGHGVRGPGGGDCGAPSGGPRLRRRGLGRHFLEHEVRRRAPRRRYGARSSPPRTAGLARDSAAQDRGCCRGGEAAG